MPTSMPTLTRRTAIASGVAALPLSASLAAPALHSPGFDGDLAIFDARVITLDPVLPTAEAVLVRQGHIAAVGSNRQIARLARGVPVFDAKRRTVIPGFVDNHCHVEQVSATAMLEFDLRALPSIAAMVAYIRAVAAKSLKGQTLVFMGGNFPNGVAERRWMTRQDLDEVGPDHPVMVILTWHASILNTAAWKATGYWDATTAANVTWRDANPRLGSYIHRDAQGHPTGVGTELWDFRPHYPVAAYKEAIARWFVPWFVAKGLTSITTLPNAAPEQWQALRELQAEGRLPARMRVNPIVPHAMTLDEVEALGLRSGDGSETMRFGGVKLFADDGLDGMGNPRVDLKWRAEDLTRTLVRCNRAGLGTIIHVVTDEGWAMTMNCLEAAHRIARPTALHRIDHYSPREPHQIARAAALRVAFGITPRRQPPTDPVRPGRYLWPHRYRSLLAANIPTILVLDVARTGGDYHPMQGIANIMAGGTTAPDEAVSLDQALRMWTLWPAILNGESHAKGSIAPGKFGDFAVLSGDPRDKHAGKVYEIVTEATICGGRLVAGR